MLAVRSLSRSTGVVQCTIDYGGHVLPTRTDREHEVTERLFVRCQDSVLFGQLDIRSDRIRLDVVFHRFVRMFSQPDLIS